MTMSKTAAIREAAEHVSIWGKGTSWTVCGPYRYADLRGPSTEVSADSYAKAAWVRTKWRARIALTLMGQLTDDADWIIEDSQGDLRTIVNRAVIAQAKGTRS